MTAVEKLAGLDLDDGWKVTEFLTRHAGATGGNFSVSYKAVKGKSIGFVKAFDFSEAFKKGKDTTKILERLVTSYNHERDVLQLCNDKRMDNVVIALAQGHVQVPGYGEFEGRVFYLIFEMADGDIRRQMDTTSTFDEYLCVRALRDIALGLWQVHKERIAHQDTKPSNVLVYAGERFKVADFGRCSVLGKPVYYDDYLIAGDKTYAPPELLYGHIHNDFAARRLGTDLFMLGNLAGFLFTGVNISSYIFNFVDDQHRPHFYGGKWVGLYEDVLPYLMNGFTRVLEDVRPRINPKIEPQVLSILRELCTPDLSKRGLGPRIVKANQYSLERYVSMLDLLARKTEILIRSRRNAG